MVTLGLICRGKVRVTADLAVTLLFMPANLGATLVSIYRGNMRVLLGRSLAQPCATLANVNKPRPRLRVIPRGSLSGLPRHLNAPEYFLKNLAELSGWDQTPLI